MAKLLIEMMKDNGNEIGKTEIVRIVYLNYDFIFPSLGPSSYGKKQFLMHHPLTEINILFLIIILITIIFAIIISFRYSK